MPLLFNPYVLLGLLVGALALAGGGYFKGISDEKARCTVRMDQQQNESIKLRQAEAQVAASMAAQLETANAKASALARARRTVVERVVDRPVYKSICLDADGLSIANSALTGQAPDPTEPASAVPKPHPP